MAQNASCIRVLSVVGTLRGGGCRTGALSEPQRASNKLLPKSLTDEVIRPAPGLETRVPFVYPMYIRGGAMKTKIAKWGNSLALRVPQPLAEEVGLKEGAEVEL